MAQKTGTGTTFVRIDGGTGHSVVAPNSPLKRLHYFDGKFLRAPDMQLEQQAMLQQIRLSNRAAGPGVVYGYSCMQGSGDSLRIGAGLAYDAMGRALYLLSDITVDVSTLIETSRQRYPLKPLATKAGDLRLRAGFDECEEVIADKLKPSHVIEEEEFYVVTLSHVEAYCGQEDVYGKLCEEACVDSQQRPYIIEGVVIHCEPLSLPVALPHSQNVAMTGRHLRSRLAAAYFEAERRNPSSHISANGLRSGLWCGGAAAATGNSVAIALLARSGGTTRFVDAWSARRERIEAPPAHYWSGRMGMRSWNTFLAQLLQFQCQLTACFAHESDEVSVEDDPCADERQALESVKESIEQVLSGYEVKGEVARPDYLSRFEEVVSRISRFTGKRALPQRRLLLNCGIVELPSAGYLPVETGSAKTVNEQVRRMLGEGIDLRFCVVRHDYIPHALEESQHMERISLLQGIDNPEQLEEVDILVPDGSVAPQQEVAPGTVFEMKLCRGAPKRSDSCLKAAANYERLAGGGLLFAFAGSMEGALFSSADEKPEITPLEINNMVVEKVAAQPVYSRLPDLYSRSQSYLWCKVQTSRDPLSLSVGDSCTINLELATLLMESGIVGQTRNVYEFSQHGMLLVEKVDKGPSPDDVVMRCRVDLNGMLSKKSIIKGVETTKQSYLKRRGELIISLRSGDLKPALNLQMSAAKNDWIKSGQTTPFDQGYRLSLGWKTAEEAVLKFYLQDEMLMKESTYKTHNSYVVAQPTPTFTAQLRANPQVRKPGNGYHDTALLALNAIGSAMGEPQFDDLRARLLFPPAVPLSDELKIYGVRDWVLFKRRRSIICAHPMPQSDVVVPPNYRLYYVEGLPSVSALNSLRQALLDNDSATINQFKPEYAGVVEYVPGLASIDTPLQALRLNWDNAVGEDGVPIMFGAIGSHGETAAEGDALAGLRMDALGKAVATITPQHEAAEYAVLPTTPDLFRTEETCGAIVLASISVQTVCHKVYRVAVSPEQVSDVINAFVTSYTEAEKQFDAIVLPVQPLFESGSADFVNEAAPRQLIEEWKRYGGGKVGHEVSLYQAEQGGNVADAQPFDEQGMAISRAVDSTCELEPSVYASKEAIDVCAAITVLMTPNELTMPPEPQPIPVPEPIPDPVAVPVIACVHSYDLKRVLSTVTKDLISLIKEAGYWEMLEKETVPLPLQAGINVAADLAVLKKQLEKLKAQAAEVGVLPTQAGITYALLLIHPQGIADEVVAQYQEQASYVEKALGIERGATMATGGNAWDSNCNFVLRVVADKTVSGVRVVSSLMAEGAISVADIEADKTFNEVLIVDENLSVAKSDTYASNADLVISAVDKPTRVEVIALSEDALITPVTSADAVVEVLKNDGLVATNVEVVKRLATSEEREVLRRSGEVNDYVLLMNR